MINATGTTQIRPISPQPRGAHEPRLAKRGDREHPFAVEHNQNIRAPRGSGRRFKRCSV